MSTDREALRLRDIVDNIDRIDRYVVGLDWSAFDRDDRTSDAVQRCLQRICEAVIQIGAERMSQISPHTPVEAVRGLGNVPRHDYDSIDRGTIYRTIKESLPDLRADCLRVLSG